MGCSIGHLKWQIITIWEPTPLDVSEISRVYVSSELTSGDFASFECISEETWQFTSDVMTISC